jgi:hypothetical protein
VVVDAEVKRNKEDHSSEWMERSAQNELTGADIVRDFWLSERLRPEKLLK